MDPTGQRKHPNSDGVNLSDGPTISPSCEQPPQRFQPLQSGEREDKNKSNKLNPNTRHNSAPKEQRSTNVCSSRGKRTPAALVDDPSDERPQHCPQGNSITTARPNDSKRFTPQRNARPTTACRHGRPPVHERYRHLHCQDTRHRRAIGQRATSKRAAVQTARTSSAPCFCVSPARLPHGPLATLPNCNAQAETRCMQNKEEFTNSNSLAVNLSPLVQPHLRDLLRVAAMAGQGDRKLSGSCPLNVIHRVDRRIRRTLRDSTC